MRASLIGAGLFALIAVGCSGSKGDNLFGAGGASVTGGAAGASGSESDGSAATGTGGGGGTTGTGGAVAGTGGAPVGTGGTSSAGGAAGTGGGTPGTGGSVIPPRSDGGGVVRVDASTPDVGVGPGQPDAAIDAGGGGAVIACGNDSCAVGNEQCCEANVTSCVALVGGGMGGAVCPNNAPRLRCDDGSDCPGAQVCCASPMGGGNNSDIARCIQLANCPAQNSQVLCDPADPNACPRQGEVCSVTQAAIFPNRPFCHN